MDTLTTSVLCNANTACPETNIISNGRYIHLDAALSYCLLMFVTLVYLLPYCIACTDYDQYDSGQQTPLFEKFLPILRRVGGFVALNYTDYNVNLFMVVVNQQQNYFYYHYSC